MPKRTRSLPERMCREQTCRRIFQPHHERRMFCSDRCRNLAGVRKIRERQREKAEAAAREDLLRRDAERDAAAAEALRQRIQAREDKKLAREARRLGIAPEPGPLPGRSPRAQRPVIRIEMLDGQREFFCALEPTVGYIGAYRAGKTRILCLKILALMLHYPGAFAAIVRKRLSTMRLTTIRTFFEITPPEYVKEYNKNEGLVTLVNGSQVAFCGLDATGVGQQPAIAGLTADFIGVDESTELEQQDWTTLQGRLSGTGKAAFRQLMFASNPCPPGSYQHRHFVDDGNAKIVRSNMLQNKFLPQDVIERNSALRGMYYDRYVLGLCRAAEGLVYDCFDPAVHLLEPFPIPADWPRYRAIDFGYANPFVCLWGAEQPHEATDEFPYPRGTLFIYREWYRSRMLVEHHARRITELSTTARGGERFPESVRATWADHDAEDRATLFQHGVYTMPALKEVSLGIQAVYKRLAGGEDGVPRLYVLRDVSVDTDSVLAGEKKPTGLVGEFGGYVWEQAREGKAAKESPRKENDHALDALRYLVMGVERSAIVPVSFH